MSLIENLLYYKRLVSRQLSVLIGWGSKLNDWTANKFRKVRDFMGGLLIHFVRFRDLLESFVSEYIKIVMSFVSYQVDLLNYG